VLQPQCISFSFYVILAVDVSLIVLAHVVACLTLCISAGGVDVRTSTETVVLSLFNRIVSRDEYFFEGL
jgi:hypothetical protein